MVSAEDPAPEVTAQMARGAEDLAEFSLADATEAGPVVLAFFPLAFSSVCTRQVADVEQHYYDDLVALDAQVYGVSVDSPFTLQAFHEEEALSFPLVSDFNREIVDAFDVETDVLDYEGVAQRAVFVVDQDGIVAYADVLEDGSEIPDMDPVIDVLSKVSGDE